MSQPRTEKITHEQRVRRVDAAITALDRWADALIAQTANRPQDSPDRRCAEMIVVHVAAARDLLTGPARDAAVSCERELVDGRLPVARQRATILRGLAIELDQQHNQPR